MVTSMDFIPLLEGIIVCTYHIASLHPLFLSSNLSLCCFCVCFMFFTKVCPTGVFGLVIVIYRLVSGGCFAVVVLAPLCGRYLLSSVCEPLTLRMLCRQGCSGGCLAVVVVVLSAGCFAAVVAGSLTSLGGCFATVVW
jgi:hypothetical protein